MEIRKLHPSDDLFAVSRVYEESWREAYRGLLPQEYLDSIPLGKWVPYLEQAGRESLLLLKGEKIVGTASCCASRTPELAGWGEIASIYLLFCPNTGGTAGERCCFPPQWISWSSWAIRISFCGYWREISGPGLSMSAWDSAPAEPIRKMKSAGCRCGRSSTAGNGKEGKR